MYTWKSYPKQEIPGTYGFTGELYPTFKEDVTPNLHNFSQTTDEKKHFPIHLWGQHYPDTKLEKNSIKDKIKESISNFNPATFKKNSTSQSSMIYPRNTRLIQHLNINKYNPPY